MGAGALKKMSGVLVTLGLLCQCQVTTTSIQSSVFENRMMDDVRRNKPWVPYVFEQTGEDKRVGGGPVVVTSEDTFQERVDDPQILLAKARSGDSQAGRKLQDYVAEHSNPNPTIAFEFERLAALSQGIYGIGHYYAEHRGVKTSKDRKSIEQAIRRMEIKALNGDWIYAVALYQFLGAVNQRGGRLPWGKNEELSAKWLGIIYKSTNKLAFETIVDREAMRMGE